MPEITIDQLSEQTEAQPGDVTVLDNGIQNFKITMQNLAASIMNLYPPPFIDDYLDLVEGPDPSAPDSGKQRIFAGEDGKLYRKNSANLKSGLGGGGSGGKNYIQDPDTAPGTTGRWDSSGAGVTVATTTTTANLPEESKGTGILITPVSGTTDYARYRFTLDDADKGVKLPLRFSLKALSGYAAGDLVLELYSQSASDYSGSYTSVPLLVSDIPAVDSIVFGTEFDAAGADYYELRIRRAAGTTGIVISGVFIGPDPVIPGYPAGPLGNIGFHSGSVPALGTITINTADFNRDGNILDGHLNFTAGTPTGATVALNLPAGFTIDENKLSTSKDTNVGLGIRHYSSAVAWDSGGFVIFHDTSAGENALYWAGQTSASQSGTYQALATGSIANSGDVFDLHFRIPILEWADSPAYLGPGADPIYLYNSDITSTADPSSNGAVASSVVGAQGVTFSANWAVGTQYTRRVRSPYPIQGFKSALEVSLSGGPWIDADTLLYGVTRHGSVTYGARVTPVSGSTTDLDVLFTEGGYASTSTYGANGAAWSGLSSYKWRIRIFRPSSETGRSLATSTQTGLVKANRWQRKFYNGSTSSSSDITDLKFSNLVPGRIYKVSAQVYVNSPAVSDVDIRAPQFVINHNGSTIANFWNYLDLTGSYISNNHFQMRVGPVIFEAVATTVVFSFSGTNSQLYGDGTASTTWSQIEELNNYEAQSSAF